MSDGIVKLGCPSLSMYSSSSNGSPPDSSLCYMAPEVFEGGGSVLSDVWSLGVCLVEMVEGKNPYSECPLSEVEKHIRNDPPPIPADCSPKLKSIIEKCFRKEDTRPCVEKLMTVTPKGWIHS